FALAGDDERRNMQTFFANFSQDLDSVLLWKLEIEQKDVRIVAVDQFQRLLAICCRLDLIAPRRDQFPPRVTRGAIIFRNEYALIVCHANQFSEIQRERI